MSAAARRNTVSRLVEPAVLAQVDRLELVARRVVAGLMSGMHRSSSVGASTEFAEHRMYTPGDDIRRIDWRVYGRTDRLFVKTFQAETNMDVFAAIDTSASMGFGTDRLTKLRYAVMLAACLGHLADTQRDRFGAALYGSGITGMRMPRAVQDEGLLRMLENAQGDGQTDLRTMTSQLVDRLKRRSLLFVFSDFYQEPEDVLSALGVLSERGHEVCVVHVLDPSERNLDFNEAGIVEDAETGERFALDPSLANAELEAAVAAHCARLEQLCNAQRIDYSYCETVTPLADVLRKFVARRRRAQLRTGTG